MNSREYEREKLKRVRENRRKRYCTARDSQSDGWRINILMLIYGEGQERCWVEEEQKN